MEIKPQIITKDGKNEFVVITYSEFLKIQSAIEDYEDLMDLRSAKAETINEPSIPFETVKKNLENKKII